jgi:P-type Cu+ transporter
LFNGDVSGGDKSIMKKIKMGIDGMHCSSCAMNIDFDLEDLEGVKSAKTNYAKQVTEIEFDEEKLSEEELANQIKKTGYEASLLSK